jgi:hypothetical protein
MIHGVYKGPCRKLKNRPALIVVTKEDPNKCLAQFDCYCLGVIWSHNWTKHSVSDFKIDEVLKEIKIKDMG